MKKLLFQFIRFGMVGGICFLADTALLALLKEVFSLNVLLSAALSFSFSTVLNYLLGMRFVFVGKGRNKTGEFVTYVTLSIFGLLLNELIMFAATELLFLHYLVSKVISAALVLIYNFVTRKIFIEKHD